MKKTIKLFGFIAFIAIIGLLLMACGEHEALLKVVNQNDEPIIRVSLYGDNFSGNEYNNLNITKGNSQVFTVETGRKGFVLSGGIEVHTEVMTYMRPKTLSIKIGKTETVTLGADDILR